MTLTDGEVLKKLWALVQHLPESEDPGACDFCGKGQHMACPHESPAGHDDKSCACEFCCQ